MNEIEFNELMESDVFEIVSVEKLKDMTEEQIIKYVLRGEEERGKFTINRNQLEWKVRHRRKLNLDGEDNPEVIKMYKHKEKNKRSGEFGYPYLDERMHDLYIENGEHLFQGVRRMSGKDYLTVIDTVKKESIFGLVDTYTYVGKAPLKYNDNRYEDLVYNRRPEENCWDEKNFYYDYKDKIWVQFDKSKVSYGEEKGEEFKRRDKLIDFITEEFLEKEEKFVTEFENRYNDLKKMEIGSVSLSREFLKSYEELLELTEVNLDIKLVLSKVSEDEREKLKLAITIKQEKIDDAKKRIDKIVASVGLEDFKFTDNQFNDDLEVQKLVRILGTNSSGLKHNLINFITKKPEFKDKKDEKMTELGYLSHYDLISKKYEDESNDEAKIEKFDKVYPNLGTLTSRYFFTEHQSSKDKVRMYEKELLELINKQLKDIENNQEIAASREEQNYKQIFEQLLTKEELESAIQDWKEGRKNKTTMLLKDKMKINNIDSENSILYGNRFKDYLNKFL